MTSNTPQKPLADSDGRRSMRRVLAAGLCSLFAGMIAPAAGQTLKPALLPATAPLFNPLSGPYVDLAQNPATLALQALNPQYSEIAPLAGLPPNEYGRVSWHSLEPRQGHYDFSIIGQVLQPCPPPTGSTLCLPHGSTFGFRIMALNPQVASDTNVTTGADGYPVYTDVPAYIETPAHGWTLPVDPQDPTQGHYFVPDWNDPFVLARMEALLAALGHRFDGDRRIGWLDIGLYGSWGEWHTSGLPDAADYTRGIPYDNADPYYALNTQAHLENTGQHGAYRAGTVFTKNAIVDAYAAAFPSTRLVMLTDDGEGVCHALHRKGPATPIGLRRDSLGSQDWTYQFPSALPYCDTAADQAMIQNRWKTAPFIAEPFGNGSSQDFPCQTFTIDSATGVYDILEQVPQFHVAAIKNASFCAGTWADLSSDEQQATLTSFLQAGYRLAPVTEQVHASAAGSAGTRLTIDTAWANTGNTPTYTA